MPPRVPFSIGKGTAMGGAALIVLALLGLGVAEHGLVSTEPVGAENRPAPVEIAAAPQPAAPPAAAEPADMRTLEIVHDAPADLSADEPDPAVQAAPAESDAISTQLAEKSPDAAGPSGDQGVQPNLGGIPLGKPAPKPSAAAPRGEGSRPELSDMVGQMIVVGFVGVSASDPGAAAAIRQIAEGEIGGVMWMGRNVRDRAQVRALNQRFSSASGALAPLISVDQEGGKVQRLKRNGFDLFPSAQAVAADPRWNTNSGALKLYLSMAGQLSSAGFNVNFGPVVDLNTNRRNPVIGGAQRSYGDNPETVTDFASAFATAHRQKGILTAAKHFPGHGSSRVDSHKGFTDISHTWKQDELEPYRRLAQDNMVDMVMVGHLWLPEFSDGGDLPTSLSHRAISRLRNDVKFQGVVVSDDMEMGAIRKQFSDQEAIIRAVNAGVDILVFSNTAKPDANLGRRINAVIVKAVNDGRIDRSVVEDAYDRIQKMKGSLPARQQAMRN